MAKSVQLLLTENVDNLGIVGDVVNVRTGYARNFLLPRGMATTPSDEMIKSLTQKRRDAEQHLGEVRVEREALIKRMSGIELTMTRSANDQGILYGAVTQQELAAALVALGYKVKPREVRIPQTIKRVDAHDIVVKFDSDLEATVKLHVVADKTVQKEEREEMDFDNEGNLVDKSKAKRSDWRDKLGDQKGERRERKGGEGGGEGGGGGGGDRPARPEKVGRMGREEAARKAMEEGTRPVKPGWGAKPKPAEAGAAPAPAPEAPAEGKSKDKGKDKGKDKKRK